LEDPDLAIACLQDIVHCLHELELDVVRGVRVVEVNSAIYISLPWRHDPTWGGHGWLTNSDRRVSGLLCFGAMDKSSLARYHVIFRSSSGVRDQHQLHIGAD